MSIFGFLYKRIPNWFDSKALEMLRDYPTPEVVTTWGTGPHPESYGWRPGMKCIAPHTRFVGYAVMVNDLNALPEAGGNLDLEIKMRGRYLIYLPSGEPLGADTMDELERIIREECQEFIQVLLNSDDWEKVGVKDLTQTT